MKTLTTGIWLLLFLTMSAMAEWKIYTLDNGAEHRELIADAEKIYHFSTIITRKGTERRVTNHQFYWKGVLALTLQEYKGMDDSYMGNSCTTHPESKVETNTWDYNRDGVIDVITIGKVNDPEMLVFGRYKDGVFGKAPTDVNFTDLWKHLSLNNSEQAGTGKPATRPDSKSEGSDKTQPASEGRTR